VRGGDADTTAAILFRRLLEWDTDKEMDKMIKKTAQINDYHLIYLKKILNNCLKNQVYIFL
jgi:hypothetical protein